MPRPRRLDRWRQFAEIGAREVAWLVRQTMSYIVRGLALLWEALRDFGLRSQRRRIFEQLGEEIRKLPDSPESLSVFTKACDDAAVKVQSHSKPPRDPIRPEKWLERLRRNGRLVLANSAYRRAVVRLGEAGAAGGSRETQARLGTLERALSVEGPARRQRLLAPWNALSTGRRVAVRTALLVLIGITVFVFRGARPDTSVAVDAETPDNPPREPQQSVISAAAHMETFERESRAAPPGQWVFFLGNPVLSRGELTAWDDFKVTSPVVIQETGLLTRRFRMWYRGCHFIGDEYTCGIGHATSDDGLAWKKSPHPIFVPDNEIDRKRLGSIAVAHVENRYYLWYSVDLDIHTEQPPFIALATSGDGSTWKNVGVVLKPPAFAASLELSALHDGRQFHLWYADGGTSLPKAALAHWVSGDGERWQMAGSTPLSTLVPTVTRISVIADGTAGYVGHFARAPDEQRPNGSFGTMVSSDGNTWRLLAPDSKGHARAQPDGDSVTAPVVLADRDRLWSWFVLQSSDGAAAIGVARRKEVAR